MATRAAARNGVSDIHAFPFESNMSESQGSKVKDNPQHNLCHQTNVAFQQDRMLEIQVQQRTLAGNAIYAEI